MKGFGWLVLIAFVAAVAYMVRRWRTKWAERQRAAEERFASLMASARPAVSVAPLVPAPVDPKERLLLEAASKAGEAGEPVLCIQLYAKLLSRFPQTQFATQARAAVEQQKKKLANA